MWILGFGEYQVYVSIRFTWIVGFWECQVYVIYQIYVNIGFREVQVYVGIKFMCLSGLFLHAVKYYITFHFLFYK